MRRRLMASVTAGALAVPMLAALATAQSPGPTSPGTSLGDGPPWIAYQTTGQTELDSTWLVHPDGSGDLQIGADITDRLFLLPDWSPDGRRLALASRSLDGDEPIYEYDLATDTFTRLLSGCEEPDCYADEPAYSPDGTKLAFIRYLGPLVDDVPSDCGLWLGDLSTGEVTQIASNPRCDNGYHHPRWSPDGTRLVFMRELADHPGGPTTATAVFVMDADGANEQQLTDWEAMAGEPDWSPDGDWIVHDTYPPHDFMDLPAPLTSNLYRMHPDGTGAEQLTFQTDASKRAVMPTYTPDGSSIIFTLWTPNGGQGWLLPAAGGESTLVAGPLLGYISHPRWQPTPTSD
jgi:WD40 repeat protein